METVLLGERPHLLTSAMISPLTAVESTDSEKDRHAPSEPLTNLQVCPSEADFIAACISGDVCKLRHLLSSVDEKQDGSVIPNDLLLKWPIMFTAVEWK